MKSLAEDALSCTEKMTPQFQFKHLRQDVHPLYGLQDWSANEWRVAFKTSNGKELSKELSLQSGYPDLVKRIEEGLTMDEWVSVVKFQNKHLNGKFEGDANRLYLHESVLIHSLHQQLFPLGIYDTQDWRFAVRNSGVYRIEHNIDTRCTRWFMLSLLCVGGIAFLVYLIYLCNLEFWSLEHTRQINATSVETSALIMERTKERGTLASIFGALTFSLLVNTTIDIVGKINASTSTALIGIVLGNTWGFVLDNILGSDEGFREYMWDTWGGMKYGLGALYSVRFVRYVITLVFDLFFTVILFRQFYPTLIRMVGFSSKGREWIANGFVSTAVSLLTYQVYANMTRFQWAYPSGGESVFNQWISGPTMLLATVVMNMVYLTTETRIQQNEPGINDPRMKIIVTIVNFVLLSFLQMGQALDPSERRPVYTDESLSKPLYNVCYTQSKWVQGFGVYLCISSVCIGGVIFGTSKLNLFPKMKYPYLITQIVLFVVYMILTIIIVLMFSTIPLFKTDETRDSTYKC